MNSYTRRKYLRIMQEIQRRIEAVKDLNSGKTSTTYLQTTIETEALQIRKILELIAYSSLVANKTGYSTARQNFAKDWHAKRILKAIETVNSSFYPTPIVKTNKGMWNKKKNGYLTRKQFEKLYDRCSDFLHSDNPFSKPKRSITFHDKVCDYINKIEALIENHTIQLSSSLSLRVHLSDDGEYPLKALLLSKNPT